MKNRLRSLVVAAVAIFAIVTVNIVSAGAAPPRGFGGRSGGFGGGGRSFSSGGGGFGGSHGLFGGGQSSSSFTRSGSGSFSRSGAFGSSGRIHSTTMAPRTSFGGGYGSSRFYYGGHYAYYGGGYGDYWYHPAWYYWLPFHPAFYYSAPYYDGGYYHPGGFSFMRFLIGIFLIFFILWIIGRLLFGGGGRGGGIKYTMYQ